MILNSNRTSMILSIALVLFCAAALLFLRPSAAQCPPAPDAAQSVTMPEGDAVQTEFTATMSASTDETAGRGVTDNTMPAAWNTTEYDVIANAGTMSASTDETAGRGAADDTMPAAWNTTEYDVIANAGTMSASAGVSHGDARHAAEVSRLANMSAAAVSDAKPSFEFYLYVNGTYAAMDGTLLADIGTKHYIKYDASSAGKVAYSIAVSSTLSNAALSAGGIPLEATLHGEWYMWDIPLSCVSDGACEVVLTSGGISYPYTICPAVPVSHGVYAAGDGWVWHGDTLTASRGADELVLLPTRAARISVQTSGVIHAATADSETVLADGGVLRIDGPVVLTQTADAAVTVAESDPVSLTLAYDDALGSVTCNGALLTSGTHTFERGQTLSLAFAGGDGAVFSGYTLNGDTGNGETLSLTVSQNISLSVSFLKLLQDVPSGGTIGDIPFQDGGSYPCTGEIRISFSAPAGAACTINGETLSPAGGVYFYDFSPDGYAHTLVFTFSRAGYRDETLTLRILPAVQTAVLSEQNVYERVYHADGSLRSDFVLYADVTFVGGARQTVPLTFQDDTAHYAFSASLFYGAYRVADVTLCNHLPQLAAFLAAEMTPSARYEAYAMLTEARTQEELAYLHAYISRLGVLADLLPEELIWNADDAFERIAPFFSAACLAAGMAEEDVRSLAFTLLAGDTPLTRENFSALWRGGKYHVRLTLGTETVVLPDLLRVPPRAVSLAVTQKTASYTGAPLFLFDPATDLKNVLPSATANSFVLRCFRIDGTQVESICDAGEYYIEIAAADPAEYTVVGECVLAVTVAKRNISDAIALEGLQNGTVYLQKDFLLVPVCDGFDVTLCGALNGKPLDSVTPQDIAETGSYEYTVSVLSPNYCGEKTFSFYAVFSFEETVSALRALRLTAESSTGEERLDALLALRAAVQSALQDDAAPLDDALMTEIALCEALWEDYLASVQTDREGIPLSATPAALFGAINSFAAAFVAIGKFSLLGGIA